MIDALFFPQSTVYEVERINHKRKKKNSNRSSSSIYPESFDEEKIITKMRLLILGTHNYTTLTEIHQTSIDETIELLEK